ncbi:hypothetical protein MUK42_36115 [Musa troglodytarum]|uniref:Uncharacterized protein n=1 Tax=Musa troglodytarum TaxID=320322 RepID=A0A9E7KQT2_9LILI|nr:hypothetical protein MUK42_36115 [Musa troglodytarum]
MTSAQWGCRAHDMKLFAERTETGELCSQHYDRIGPKHGHRPPRPRNKSVNLNRPWRSFVEHILTKTLPTNTTVGSESEGIIRLIR